MISIAKLRNGLISFSPEPLARLLSFRSSKTLAELVQRLDVKRGKHVEVNGSGLRQIELASGLKLISHRAARRERKILGWVAREKGLDPSYTRVLTDAITRFMYAHVSAPINSMDFPIHERKMLHPQHVNFVQEDSDISREAKLDIFNRFQPKNGWYCLDIGAFLGFGATWLRQQIGESGKIICVEAKWENKLILDKNMQQNQFDNIDSKHAAIWHTAGESVSFNLTARQGNAIDSEVVAGSKKVAVPTVSISSLTHELGRPADLVSLTVNGAEIEAIESLRQLDRELLPRRIIAPGWYLKNNQPRATFLKTLYDELGYKCQFTRGLLSVAWIPESRS